MLEVLEAGRMEGNMAERRGLGQNPNLSAKGVALTSASPLAGMGTHTQGAGRCTGLPIAGSRNRAAALRKLLASFHFFYPP